jgi:hypothetical protein
MSSADRCGALAAITGALAMATGHAFFGYATVILLWWAFVELSVTLRAERKRGRS